jgi:YfiH family protein
MALTTIKIGSLEYLTAPNIPVPHGFTTRLGGVSQGHLESLNLGSQRGDYPENVAENYRILGDAIGFCPGRLVLANQIHTDIVRVVTETDCIGSLDHRDYPECDALVTNTAGVGLVVFTADCTPILFHDPVTGAVGAAHAGWRGTAAGIAAKTVQTMVSAFGCCPEDIRATIGPNIGPCCFETDRDVPDAMIAALGHDGLPFIRAAGEKFHVDLKGINALWLRRSGVKNIEISTECTCCAPHRFWSHRATKGVRGSQGAVIVCK